MGNEWVWLLLGAGLGIGIVALAYFFKPMPQLSSMPAVQLARTASLIRNEETWQWQDWQGNSRSITVYRTVKKDD